MSVTTLALVVEALEAEAQLEGEVAYEAARMLQRPEAECLEAWDSTFDDVPRHWRTVDVSVTLTDDRRFMGWVSTTDGIEVLY